MERLLTPLVTRWLERFVKRSQEGDAGKFKVALSGAGGFSLHNLELDLGSVLPAELLESRRAFARSLQIKVPWTALNTQPIEVIFDTVEIVLGDPTQRERSSSQDEQPKDAESDLSTSATSTTTNTTTATGGGWLGLGSSSSWLTSNLQSLALRAGLNLSFTIKNLVIKYVCSNDFVVTVALEQLLIANQESIEWRDLVENPEAWLMKNCLIKGFSISSDTTSSSILHTTTYLPLLRLSSVSFTALLPIFYYIEGVDLTGDEAKVAVEVQLGSVQGAVNDQQIEWMYKLALKLQTTSDKQQLLEVTDAVVALAPTETEETRVPSPTEKKGIIKPDDNKEEVVEENEPQMKALGIFSRIWNVAVDEASYIRNLEEETLEEDTSGGGSRKTITVITAGDPSSRVVEEHRHPPTQAELTLSLTNLRLQLGIANKNTRPPTFIKPSDTDAPPSHPSETAVGGVSIGPSVVPLLEIELGLTRVCTASINTTMLDVEMQIQNISLRHNSNPVSGEVIVHLLERDTTSFAGILAEEEAIWDEIFGIHPCAVPLRSAGRLRSPDNALELQKIVLDINRGDDSNGMSSDESSCSMHVGQVWIAIDPMLRHHIELFTARLASMSAPSPSPLEVGDGNSQVVEVNGDKSMWSSISGWDIEVDALQVALRCLMKNNNNTNNSDTAASSETSAAALLIQATEAISYHTQDTANAFRPQGFQCPLNFSVVHGWWQPMSERTGQHTAAVPGSVKLSKEFTLSGSLRQDHLIQGPFFSISPLVLDGSGEEIAAALSCILAAVAGSATEPRDPLPLLSGWAGRAQLSLKQGLRLNKDLKSGSNEVAAVLKKKEKAWEVFASNLSLILTSEASLKQRSGGAGASTAAATSEEEVCATLDLTTLRCYASPGLAITVDLACLGVEMHKQEKTKRKKEEDILPSLPPPPPLAILTNFSMRSEDTVQEYTFGSLNIMSDPSTTIAAMALAAGFRNNKSSVPNPPPAAAARQNENKKVKTEQPKSTTCYGFDMVIFTLFPAKKLGFKLPDVPATAVFGLTGWLSCFSLEVGPLSRRVSLNCLELSQCRLDDVSNSKIITLPRNKVLSFEHKSGTLVCQASSTVVSNPSKQPQEQFTMELAPLKARLTPELLYTFNAFLPAEIATNNVYLTEVLVTEPNAAGFTPVLHGNVTLGRCSLELTPEEEWAGDQSQSSCCSKPLLIVSFDEAFILVHQDLASERRPWLHGTSAMALTASASVLGLGARVENHAGGTGSDCTQILLPADINALIHHWSPTRSLVAALESHSLDFKVSKNVADALASLTSAFSTTEPTTEAFEDQIADNTLLIDILSDDLRSGVFILAGSDTTLSGLQPLRAAVRPLGGHGKESLEWRYACPRSIGCIYIQSVEPSDFSAPLSLSRLDETTGEFINIELWPKIIQGAQFAGTGFFVAEGAQDATAHFWRLCWTSPADHSKVNSLLNRIYINPQGQELWNVVVEDAPGRQKSPLVAPLSLGFAVGHIDVSLLAAHSSSNEATKTTIIPSVHVLNVLAVLRAENVLVSMHKWSTIHREAVAIDATMTAGVEYTEASTLCSATLIEPFDVMVSFEDVSGSQHAEEQQLAQDAGGPLSILQGGLTGVQEDAMVFAAHREPTASGSYIKLDFTTPLVVNVSELALYDLQRLATLATTAPAATMAPIKIFNETGHTIAFQQYGMPASATLLDPGTLSGFHWTATPRSHQGTQLGLQLALAGNDGNVAKISSWSIPIDVMTIGGAPITVPGSEYSSATVAVMVERDECSWHVHLKHGLRIYNQQDVMLKVLVMNPNGPQIVEIDPRESQDIPLLSAGVGGAGSPVRIWLGTSWSKEFYSQRENDPTKVLEGDSSFQFDAIGRDSTRAAAPLVAQFAGKDACSGHVVVAIWPPLKLSNQLPHPITVQMAQCLVRQDPQKAALGPSETVAVPVDITGGEIAQLTSGLLTEGNFSVALVCPPLKSTENDSPLTKGISRSIPSENAIYILSPGNAAQFLLPSKDLSKHVPCFLLTDNKDVSPGLSLKLIPQWKLINNLSIPVDLVLTESRTISIPSNSAIVDDLRVSSVRQITLSVMYEELKYSSKGFLFDLENPVEQQLTLLPLQIDNPRAALRIGLELKLTAVGEFKAFELTVSPSYFVENISSLDLIIREPSILGTALQNQELTLCAQGSLPLLIVPEHLEVALRDNIQERKLAWSAFHLDETRQDGCIFLDNGGERFTLSYGVVSEPTSQRLIFFRDSNPPVYLQNNSTNSLDLSWTSGDDQLAAVLPPAQKLEFAVDNEIPTPDAWDDNVLAADLRAYRTSIGASILLKLHGDEEWQELLLEEGEHRGGIFNVRKQRRGAGIALIVEDEEAKQVIKTLNASVHVEQFCVLLLDDERGRITGINEARPTVAVAFNRVDLNVSKASGPPAEAIVSTLRFEELRCSTCYPLQQSLLWSADSIFSASADLVITTLDGDRSVSISDAALDLPSLSLHIDDSSFELYVQYKALLEKPTAFDEVIAPPGETVPRDEAKLSLCAKRMHVNNLQIGQMNASADIHLTPGKTGLPVAVDTDRSPLSIPKMSISSISTPMHLLLQGLTKHIVAEALLNAPLVLGSLQLFFNPTGLVRSIKRGVANMIDLPLQGLQQGPLQFIAGVGQGSVSLVKEISGWSVSSVVGFSRAASNALVGSFARSSVAGLSQTPSSDLEALPRTKASLVYGFASLADHLRLNEPPIGEVILVALASDTVIHQRDQAVFKISEPVIIFATNAIILYSDNGRTPSLLAWLSEASISTSEDSLQVSSSRAAPIGDVGSACAATIVTRFHRTAWAKIAPSVRRLKHDI